MAVGSEQFAREHWGRAPLVTRAKELARDFTDLLSEDDVDELIADRALRTPFFRTVADGVGRPDPVRGATAGNRRLNDLVDPDALHAQREAGATLVLQSLHRVHPPVARFCRELADELGHPTQCNAYLTPAGDAQGFAFHHDTHDVLVLQVSGRKRWLVHEPVLAQPLRDQPRSGAGLVTAGAVPLIDTDLEPGDCLYLPRGYIHAAQTTDVPSVHLTVGVLSLTRHDLLTDVLTLAARDERFRTSLPMATSGHEGSLTADLLQDLVQWLGEVDRTDLADLVRTRLDRARPLEPLRVLRQSAAAHDLTAGTPVRPRRGLRVEVRELGDRVEVVLADRVISFPGVAQAAVRAVVASPLTPRDLVAAELDLADALVVVRRLLREGVLVPS